MSIKAIVTDIEGTTSSIDFVHKELFPYASEHLPAYIREHQHDTVVESLLQDVVLLSHFSGNHVPEGGRVDPEIVIDTLLRWIKDDNKATPLKTLQGMIWEDGYKSGKLVGHVYPDVVPNLKRWLSCGIALYVYSSGSVEAQKLLFGYSSEGDMTRYFSGYFDTGIGNKREPQSYETIVSRLSLPADEIMFLSDVLEELDAAASVGMHTRQLIREPGIPTGEHVTVNDFDTITF